MEPNEDGFQIVGPDEPPYGSDPDLSDLLERIQRQLPEVTELSRQAAAANAAHDQRGDEAGLAVRRGAQAANLELEPDERIRWVVTRSNCRCLNLQVQLADGTWQSGDEFDPTLHPELLADIREGLEQMLGVAQAAQRLVDEAP